jgi:DNA-binding MarR family transcriptional regulator
MKPLERRTHDLRDVVEDILHQFRIVDVASANGPHVELSQQELRLVEFLGDKGPHKMSELAGFLLLAVNSVTTIVDKLEKRRLVRRQRSDEDRRIVRVELTDAGRAAYQGAVNEKLQVLRGMLAALTEEEQEIFMVLFRKIARAGWSQVDRKRSTGA